MASKRKAIMQTGLRASPYFFEEIFLAHADNDDNLSFVPESAWRRTGGGPIALAGVVF
jgi:hypothetical protein